jgi:hypothetical protein
MSARSNTAEDSKRSATIKAARSEVAPTSRSRLLSNHKNIGSYSFIRIILLSIFTLVSAVLIAYLLSYNSNSSSSLAGSSNTVESAAANVEGSRGLFSSVSRLFARRPVVPASSRVPQGTATAAASFASQTPITKGPTGNITTAVMRTPVYFLSHGGVSFSLLSWAPPFSTVMLIRVITAKYHVRT